jgi:hypothetical protein
LGGLIIIRQQVVRAIRATGWFRSINISSTADADEMASTDDREKQIDAELKSADLSIEELQKKKRALLEEKRTIRTGKSGSVPPPSPQPVITDKALEKTLNLLEWTGFKKKDGEWAFLKDRQGNIVEWLEAAPEFVVQVRKGKEVKVGKYRYRVSDDKFLNRFIE